MPDLFFYREIEKKIAVEDEDSEDKEKDDDK
jgi:hypothetical protein